MLQSIEDEKVAHVARNYVANEPIGPGCHPEYGPMLQRRVMNRPNCHFCTLG